MGTCGKKGMWVNVSVLVIGTSLALIFSSSFLVHAQAVTVSPPGFTARDVPPYGEPLYIGQKLVVWNGDNIKRIFFISVEAPPENGLTENELAEGFEPIPDNKWILPVPTSVEIDENSYSEIEVWANIPRWENLTDKRWAAWIVVERKTEPGEIVGVRAVSRARIVTTKELPPPPSPQRSFTAIILVAAAVVVSAVMLGAWIWSRRRGRGVKRRDIF